jgi:hypothetical protein
MQIELNADVYRSVTALQTHNGERKWIEGFLERERIL